MIKTCPVCNKEFKGLPSKKYCSKECRKKAIEVNYEHTCLQCGKVFFNKKKQSKYCSTTCSSIAQCSIKDAGKEKARLNAIWRGVKNRCFNPNTAAYVNYGGRGITICTEWKDSFVNFFNWAMNNGYADSLSLDRIDVNKDYCPENCRWSDALTQNRNKRSIPKYTYKGKTQTLPDWAEELDISLRVLHERLSKGWTIDEVLETPSNSHYTPYKSYSKNKVKTVSSDKVDRRCICPICGKEFLRNRATQKYCSLECSTISQYSVDDIYGNKVRLKRIWGNMKQRCSNPNNNHYAYYGGRGITVCQEWKESFKTFYFWANENGYSDDLTLDRINLDGNYEPSNCKWSTKSEQANNKSNNQLITYNGETLTIGAWANKVNLTWDILDWRLNKGWSIEKALFMPRMKNATITADGRHISEVDIEEEKRKYDWIKGNEV